MFRIFVCVHSNTALLQNQELLICRFGIDEKSDYSKSTVSENGDSPES